MQLRILKDLAREIVELRILNDLTQWADGQRDFFEGPPGEDVPAKRTGCPDRIEVNAQS